MPSGTPIATYRLQLTANFDFDAAAAIVPYLKALGISHVYASPFTKARKGSTHGYDVVNHTLINPELGGDEGFERLSKTLKEYDLGLILDFVPNHVGVHFADNPWWLDVLEWGEASPHAVSFDIDWELLPYRARGGVLLPILGSSYGKALENGEIELRYDAGEGSFSAWYFEHRLPIAPERYGEILNTIVKEAGAENSAAGKRILDLTSRYHGLRHPNRKEAPDFKAGLKAIEGGEAIIERGLNAYRAGQDRPVQTQALHHLLERQHYKLGHWRLASSDINYRRFFDVNSLAGLRVEDADDLQRRASSGRTVDRGRQAARIEARSHRRPARSRAIFSAAEPPDPADRRQKRPVVLYRGRENSRRTREHCVRSPASKARPAMRRSTPLAGCWPIKAGWKRSTKPGGRSATCRPRLRLCSRPPSNACWKRC